MQIPSFLSLIAVLLLITNCKVQTTPSVNNSQELVKARAVDFFDTFAEREDWDKFCSFYSVDVAFEDVILQIQLDSLWQLQRFYKWDEEGDNFKKLSPEQDHLTIESIVVSGYTAVARGHLNPFYYHGQLIDTPWGMEFTIWLYFDKNLKVIRQVDWFEYDEQTLELTVERCRKNGFEAIPDWLDLSKQ